MTKKLLPYTGYSALFVIAVAITILLYWLYSAPAQAVTVSPNPIPVVNKTVTAGSYTQIKYSFCKNTNVSGRIVIALVGDNVQLTLPVGFERGKRTCETDKVVPLPVPPQATPGNYHFHFRATYQINPLRSIVQEYDTQEFAVN